MSPNWDLHIQDSNLLFLHDTPAYDDVLPYWVWLQMIQQFRRYHLEKHQLNFLTFCDLDCNHSNPIFSLAILSYGGLHQSKFGCKETISSGMHDEQIAPHIMFIF